MLSALVVALGEADVELHAAEVRRSELLMRARGCLRSGALAEAETLAEEAQEADAAATLARAHYLARLEAVAEAVSGVAL